VEQPQIPRIEKVEQPVKRRAVTNSLKPKTDREILSNKLLLGASISLTAITLLCFLWLVGVIEMRGTDGVLNVGIMLLCKQKEVQVKQLSLSVLLGETGEQLFFRINTANDSADHCSAVIQSSKVPRSVADIVGTPFQLKEAPVLSGAPFEKLIDGPDFRLSYLPGMLVKYIGLSEREVNINTTIYPHAGKDVRMVTDVSVARGFRVDDSEPSGEIGGDGGFGYVRVWKASVVSRGNGFEFPVHLHLKNDRLARFDHIIDSSIAAVLGVSVGGIFSAYLALSLLHRSNKANRPETHRANEMDRVRVKQDSEPNGTG
jgi:hypothetical protein